MACVHFIAVEFSLDLAEECSADHFQCADAQCVNSGAVCDGHTDCEDGSDELQRCGEWDSLY